MALYFLINTVPFGNSLLKSGTTIDDVAVDVTKVSAAGGLLLPQAILSGPEFALLQAGADAVLHMWNLGKGQQACDAMMSMYFGLYNVVEEQAHNAVVAASVGIAATNAGSAHGHTCDKQRGMVSLSHLAAPGDNYHAQFAAGALIDHTLAPGDMLIQPTPCRTVQIVLGVGGANPVTYIVDGTDCNDGTLQDTIVAAGAGTYQGTKAVKTITRVRSDKNPGGTTDFQTGNGFSLGLAVTDVDALSTAGGVKDTVVSSDAATGTVVPTTLPDGGKAFAVAYRYRPTLQNEAAHTHSLTDPTHTHNLS